MLERKRYSKRVTQYFKHINEIITDPSLHISPLFLIRMPEWKKKKKKTIAVMLCIQTFQCTVLLSSRLGPPLCDHCFVLADGRDFLLDAVAALGLVALKLKHFVCKRQYITALGFTQLAACFAAVTSFLGSF